MKIQPNINEIFRYMHSEKLDDPQILAEIEAKIELVDRLATPLATYEKFTLEIIDEKLMLAEAGIHLLGNDITKHLNNSTHCYILLSTLGIEVDRQIKKEGYTSTLSALIMDAVATEYIEKFNIELIAEIQKIENGKFLTTPFATGYGDFPLSQQKELITACDGTKKIGINLTNDNIMIPKKSISCLIGIGDTPHFNEKSCMDCNFSDSCQIKTKGQSNCAY